MNAMMRCAVGGAAVLFCVGGYQAEVENKPGKVGFLYDERRRGWMVNVGDLMAVTEDGRKERGFPGT